MWGAIADASSGDITSRRRSATSFDVVIGAKGSCAVEREPVYSLVVMRVGSGDATRPAIIAGNATRANLVLTAV